MEDLIRRLREAIDEDERVALGVPGGDWREATEDGNWNEFNEETLAHIVRHDPARVLRQVAAYRKLLQEHPVQTRKGWQGDKTTRTPPRIQDEDKAVE